jgi:4-hydroxybenzoate polyprenyltransferase
MGRSRRRARTAAATPSAPAAAVTPTELRKTLGAYLAGAILIAILVLVGTVTLAGALAPWLVLALAAAAGYALYRWAQARLAGLPLSDEDRILQTLAGGLLVVVLAFAGVAAAILTVA